VLLLLLLLLLQVESIVISIIAMLSSPNDESPANVDAAKQWREDKDGFRKKVARIVRKSQENFD
jgi:ubiquitin-conjugating enzyme E2 G1